MSLETEVTDELRDPTKLSAQERTDELVEAVRRDDLLGVVVVLRFATADEVNGRSTQDRLTALEVAVSSPVVRLDLRLLIAECLLLSSAGSAPALQLAQAVGVDELGQVLQGWSSRGREAATTARWLCDSSTALGHVEEWIEEAGFVVLDEDTATSTATEEQSAETFSAAKPVTPLASTSSMSSEPVFEPSPPLLSILKPQAAPPAFVLDTAPTRTAPCAAIAPSRLDEGVPVGIPRSSLPHPRPAPTRPPSPPPGRRTRSPPRRDAFPARRRSRSHDRRTAASREGSDRRRSRSPMRRRRSRSPPRPHAPRAPPPSSSNRRTLAASVPLKDDDRATVVADAIRASASPRLRPSPPSTDPLEFWADVSDISPTLSERYLFDVLKSIGVVMEDCLMAPHAGLARRFAYIGLRTKEDLEKTIAALDLRDTGDGPLSAHPFFDRRANATRPDFGGRGRAQEAYLGPERNAANAPHPRARTLILKHLPEWATTARVVEFVESALGPRAVQALSLHQPKGKTDQVAFVDLDHHDDALKAFALLDGATFDTRGICVLWRTDKAARPTRRANNSPTKRARSTSPPPQEPRPPRTITPPPLSTAAPSPPLPHSPHVLRVCSPPVIRATLRPYSLELDLARLRSLRLPDAKIAALQLAWEPSDDPPGPDKARTIPFDVDFGSLSVNDARAALRATKVQPAFPDDRQRQLQYEMFLRAQAGESREWYMAFLAHLAEFNALGGGFVARARELVEGSAYPTLEVPLD